MCVCLSYVLIRETLAGWGSAQLTRGCGCTRKDRELTSEIRCCHVCRPCPHNSHSEIIADWFEQSPNTISLVYHYKNQSVFPHSRHRAESNGKKNQPGIRAQPCRVDNPSLSLAWGKQLPGAFQYTDVASFLHLFFSNISSAIPLIYTGTSLFSQAEQPLHLKSNHINVSGLSTSSTWQETSLYSSTPC